MHELNELSERYKYESIIIVMKNLRFPVYTTTAFLLIFTLLSQIEACIPYLVYVFMLSPFIVIWMVYRVLKDGVPSERSFDEYFYDDVDIKRLKVKEETEELGRGK